jgi:CTP-dependent riboflavin kinase
LYDYFIVGGLLSCSRLKTINIKNSHRGQKFDVSKRFEVIISILEFSIIVPKITYYEK